VKFCNGTPKIFYTEVFLMVVSLMAGVFRQKNKAIGNCIYLSIGLKHQNINQETTKYFIFIVAKSTVFEIHETL